MGGNLLSTGLEQVRINDGTSSWLPFVWLFVVQRHSYLFYPCYKGSTLNPLAKLCVFLSMLKKYPKLSQFTELDQQYDSASAVCEYRKIWMPLYKSMPLYLSPLNHDFHPPYLNSSPHNTYLSSLFILHGPFYEHLLKI